MFEGEYESVCWRCCQAEERMVTDTQHRLGGEIMFNLTARVLLDHTPLSLTTELEQKHQDAEVKLDPMLLIRRYNSVCVLYVCHNNVK